LKEELRPIASNGAEKMKGVTFSHGVTLEDHGAFGRRMEVDREEWRHRAQGRADEGADLLDGNRRLDEGKQEPFGEVVPARGEPSIDGPGTALLLGETITGAVEVAAFILVSRALGGTDASVHPMAQEERHAIELLVITWRSWRQGRTQRRQERRRRAVL
jgi:hypothetical protein